MSWRDAAVTVARALQAPIPGVDPEAWAEAAEARVRELREERDAARAELEEIRRALGEWGWDGHGSLAQAVELLVEERCLYHDIVEAVEAALDGEEPPDEETIERQVWLYRAAARTPLDLAAPHG